MPKKTIIDWEAAAKDGAPCYFWDNYRGDAPVTRYLTEFREYSAHPFCHGGSYWKNCEFIRTEDKEKYTKTIWEGRDNFIAALKEGVEMKVEVTPEVSAELQEIAFEHGLCWGSEPVEADHLDKSRLFFYSNCITYDHIDCFDVSKCEQYYPETDSFESPVKKYRPCETWEEFKPFMGKIAMEKDTNLYSIISDIGFENTPCSLNFIWFNDWELLEPINGSKIIGVIDE